LIKLVALDVDGTLVGKDVQINERTRAAIGRARARGVAFVIVTGRMYQSSARFARELELEGMPLVAYNGAMVREYPSGRLLSYEPVPVETCRALAAYCEAHGYHLQAYVNDELYVPDLGPRTQQYMALAGVKAHAVGSLFLWLREPSAKLLVIDDPARIPAIQAEVKGLLGPAVDATPSHPGLLEIVTAGVSKGNALAAVAERLGVARDEVMAVGDGMNDMSMLTWAGTSFAMAQASEVLRKAATYVTTEGPGDGVAEALERMDLA